MDWLKSILNKVTLSSKPASTAEIAKTEQLDWAQDQARVQVRAAFETKQEIVAAVAETLEEEELTDEVSAAELVESEIAALEVEQQDWPYETDNDRLEGVFEELLGQGIVPRHNFTCCGTCGSYEIGDEIEYEEKKGTDVKGYVFYHQQDTESAVEGYGLYFNYGSALEDASDDEHLEVGQILASTLKRRGFETNWDGSLSKRVGLSIDWKRRWSSSLKFTQSADG